MYFDNAATSFPKPEPVYQALDRFMRERAANPGRSGHRLSVEADREIARARHALARLLNVPRPEQLVWTCNGTEALNLALKGLLRPGDRVVTTSLEHNSMARPLRALERSGVELVRVDCPNGRFDPEAFLAAVRPGTRLVAITHASNVTGEVLPAVEIAARCRATGARLLLDAAQTAGGYPLDVREIGADLVAMPGHKSLYGPPGTGALYIGEEVELSCLREGGTGSESELDEQPAGLPERFEAGTLNSAGIAGLGAGVAWIESVGVDVIHAHEMELVRWIWEGLSAIPSVRLYGPLPGEHRASVLSFNLEGWEPGDAAAVMDEQFDIQVRPGLHCAPWAHRSLGTFPSGTIRISPGYFNTAEEAELLVSAVRQIAG